MELNSAQINISWFCDFHSNAKTACPYCWVTMVHPNRSRNLNRPAEHWLEAIRKNIPAAAHVDFVGGEPTIFPRFHWLLGQLSPTHRWAVTSNMGSDRFRLYCENPVPNCLSWTASYHHTGGDAVEEFGRKCRAISRHYPIQVNVVEHPSYDARQAALKLEEILRDRNVKVFLSPFEDVRSVNTAAPVPLTCNGGQSHIVIDPEGHIYKCLTQERRADRVRWRLGNLFEGPIHWPTTRSICFIPCDQHYILNRKHATRDMWGLDVRELELPDGMKLSAYQETFQVHPSLWGRFIKKSPPENSVTGQERLKPRNSPGGAESDPGAMVLKVDGVAIAIPKAFASKGHRS